MQNPAFPDLTLVLHCEGFLCSALAAACAVLCALRFPRSPTGVLGAVGFGLYAAVVGMSPLAEALSRSVPLSTMWVLLVPSALILAGWVCIVAALVAVRRQDPQT